MDIQRINQHTSAFNEITHFIESENGKRRLKFGSHANFNQCLDMPVGRILR